MTDKSGDATWPGDPNFLEDKFVRFSYRFKFDDGEYSIMAPFTQIAYIPKQKGYFIEGDEEACCIDAKGKVSKTLTINASDSLYKTSIAQETSGNRIIYGNIYDVHTPPDTIDYTARSIAKTTFSSDSWIEYPNHSLKQNRSYQVGFILADKFGRQSSVILSPEVSWYKTSIADIL